MIENKTIKVIDSWNLDSIGIIAELRHSFDGLPNGLIMKSQSTGNEWRIKKRIIYFHTYGQQKMFPNETSTMTVLSFTSIEKQIISAKNILDKEKCNIFQYHIKPIGHMFKPLKDDLLVEMVNHKFACPCCGFKTYNHKPDGSYDICKVCFWEDDPIQLADHGYVGGANRISLRQAQINFRKFGACEADRIKYVQQPSKDQERDENWTWIE